MTDLSWVGVWLLVIGGVAIVIEGTLAMLWSLRVSRRAAVLNERLKSQQAELQSYVARLRGVLAETQTLWQPYGRLLRWLRHPLTIALMQSFVRRMAAAR